MKYIITIELILLPIMILAKAVILRRNGIVALKFSKPDKNALTLIVIIAGFVYAASASALGLPFPAFAGKSFWNIHILSVLAIVISSISLIWFGMTLITFGNSFRIGIDEKTNNRLITTGTFAISRNPVFLAFIAFFLGVFLMYSNMITLTFLLLLMMMVHRQILKEEIFLKTYYGKEYEDYCAKVRRYI
jgi:protein-S-isoprenylcysteine O-methyltransferase Ste14